MSINVVFMGSPEFALPSLQALSDSYNVIGVVTQPDRRAGRGKKLKSSQIKDLANALNIPLIQPKTLRKKEAFAQLNEWNPDLIVVTAFGQILRQNVLDLPRYGCINVHASLLPRWRGAAPINAVILNGDTKTGITIMRMDTGIDTGDILAQQETTIDPQETAGKLSQRLSQLGGEFLIDTLGKYIKNEIVPRAQDDSLSTYAPMLKKQDGELDFSKPATNLVNQIRGYNPWPGSFLKWRNKSLKIHQANSLAIIDDQIGTRVAHKGFPAVHTAEGLLVLDEVQPSGKKKMSGDIFLRGARDWDTT